MKLWIILLVIAMLVAPKAFADPGAELSPDDATATSSDAEMDERENIIVWLGHYHKIPDRRQFESISDDARDIIFEIAQDEEAPAFYQRRAMKALSNWADEEVYEYLVGVLDEKSTDDGLRHHLLLVLADGFGEEALDHLRPYLFEASDPHLRISAANAIAQIPGDRAYEMLVDALHQEEHPVVESRLKQFAPRLR